MNDLSKIWSRSSNVAERWGSRESFEQKHVCRRPGSSGTFGVKHGGPREVCFLNACEDNRIATEKASAFISVLMLWEREKGNRP
jgi:hypothetical protein